MNIDQIISTIAGESLDYKQYKNNPSEITSRGGVIIGGAKVPYSKIDLDNEIYQTRHLTKDPGHVSILASDIAVVPLVVVKITCFPFIFTREKAHGELPS